MKTSLKRTILFLLTARWRAAPFEDLIRPWGFSAPGPLTWMLSPALELRLPGRQRWPFSSPEERNYRFPPSEWPLSKRPRFSCPPLHFLPEALPPTSGLARDLAWSRGGEPDTGSASLSLSIPA